MERRHRLGARRCIAGLIAGLIAAGAALALAAGPAQADAIRDADSTAAELIAVRVPAAKPFGAPSRAGFYSLPTPLRAHSQERADGTRAAVAG